MHLLNALEIGKDMGLKTVKEAIYNICCHADYYFKYDEVNKRLNQLCSEWKTIEINFDFNLESLIESVIYWMKNVNIALKDEFGGIHDEGLGWNTQGVFCGECSNITCYDCPMKDKKIKCR